MQGELRVFLGLSEEQQAGRVARAAWTKGRTLGDRPVERWW